MVQTEGRRGDLPAPDRVRCGALRPGRNGLRFREPARLFFTTR